MCFKSNGAFLCMQTGFRLSLHPGLTKCTKQLPQRQVLSLIIQEGGSEVY